MEQLIDGIWTRVCPQCSSIVEHRSKAKCRDAENHSRPCAACSRRNTGKANALSDVCPICNETIRIPTNNPSDLYSHAEQHGKTPEEMWLLTKDAQPQKCKCGCEANAAWNGWWSGYNDFIIGHNAYIHCGAYNEETEAKLAMSRGSNWRGKESMWLGRTKDIDVRTKARGVATSKGWKRKIDSGYVVWAAGQTAETHAGIARAAKTRKAKFASGELIPHMKGKNKNNSEVVREMAEKISLAHKDKNLRKRLDDMKRLNAEDVQKRIETGSTLRVLVDSLVGYHSDAVPNILVECTQCKERFTSSLRRLQHGRCYKCDPSGSRGQQDVANWFRSLGVLISTCDRAVLKGQELDVFAPAHGLAVEFNGLHWHSILYKSSMYHDQKSQMCEASGNALVHIFDDEWREKRSIVESMLKHKMNMTLTKIGARKCTVVELNSPRRHEFFEANHIDGDTAAKITWGLVNEGRIVAAMSLRSPFHKKHSSSLEVARFCCSTNTNVNGALGRLTSIAKKHAKNSGITSLLSYIDTRFGTTGASWTTAGWTKEGETTPRFWWTNGLKRFNRFKFKASKSRGMSEAQVADEANVVKIYGCRNVIFATRCD